MCELLTLVRSGDEFSPCHVNCDSERASRVMCELLTAISPHCPRRSLSPHFVDSSHMTPFVLFCVEPFRGSGSKDETDAISAVNSTSVSSG